MLLYLSGKFNKLDFISLAFILTALFVSVTLIRNYFDTQISTLKTEVLLYKDALGSFKKKLSVPRYPFARNYDREDYHDYEFIISEEGRSGPGENGLPYYLINDKLVEENRRLYEQIGFHGLVSDHISVNRSLPDVRHEKCKKKKYLKQLSKVSIIIVFYNEHTSMLKRTLHSVYNRTPHKLINEIILVNDNSTSPELYEPFEEYVITNFADFVKIRVLNERRGMIIGRMEGARFAKGEVLVFLDAHVEVNVNWLPPLLEPIALNPKIITTPIVDILDSATFAYLKRDNGGRGIFNWDLEYRRVSRRPEDKIRPETPFLTPVMVGSVFAINRQYFWDMGAYDGQLRVAQGEQFEMSLKAHLCGQGIVECPCSRVGNIKRNKNYYKSFENGTDFAARNLKRIVEVWFDEYQNVVLNRHPERYKSVDAGNLARERTIRLGLHCRPFQFFLEFVAPEILERYPVENPGYFVRGAIRSKSNPKFCLEATNVGNLVDGISEKLIVKDCSGDYVNPQDPRQAFTLTYQRNIQLYIYDYCIDNTLNLNICHFQGGNQLWQYNLDTSQLINPLKNATTCLTLDSNSQKLLMDECNEDNINQKWNWGEKNLTALRSWENFGVELTSLNLGVGEKDEEEDDY
ncbi:hypothetical protein PVAND_013377 [Polypedilum vanderplanki]|uniref:Polypeptide N-acetylgalactosaminyltransferase n=1 Tax=Polypedilum vanderplanki TaxID=319348 RepID=A0A9J6CQA7_POLVA|nr:hypothetical protein PVAND_013377 [Polypedilum vanderplanki]